MGVVGVADVVTLNFFFLVRLVVVWYCEEEIISILTILI